MSDQTAAGTTTPINGGTQSLFRFLSDHLGVLVVSVITFVAAFAWQVNDGERVTALERGSLGLEKRIEALESGRAVPMSDAVKSEIQSLRRDNARLENTIKDLWTELERGKPKP